MKRKIKAIKSGYPNAVNSDIQEWMNKNPEVYIISVNGTMRNDGDTVTYILYEEERSELNLLNS